METKIDYFITQTNKKLEQMDRKLDLLMGSRMLMIGASMAVSLMCTVFFNLAILYFKG